MRLFPDREDPRGIWRVLSPLAIATGNRPGFRPEPTVILYHIAKTLFCRRLSHRERESERVRERSYSCETKPRGRSLSPNVRVDSFKHRAREYASKVVVVKPSQPMLRNDKNETRRTFPRHLSSKDANEETKNKALNVPGRTPRRCTIDRRNNPSLSRPRRITRLFRWNLSPRLRLSRLGTRPSGRRCKLGRGNPFVRGVRLRVFCAWEF